MPVLVHYHIFKNAGTSLDHLLRQGFGAAWAKFDSHSPTDLITTDRLRSFLAENPRLRAVSSHLARPPLPGPDAYPLVFLRHPLERVRSVHAFAARDRNQPDHAIARQGGLRRYVEWALTSEDGGVVIRNYQVVHLSAASFRAPHIYLAQAEARDLAEARALLAEWGVVGLAREFAASCQLFQQRYGSIFPELKLAPIHLNVTNPGYTDDATEMQRLREELGDELYRRLEAANELDLGLYETARHLFRQGREA